MLKIIFSFVIFFSFNYFSFAFEIAEISEHSPKEKTDAMLFGDIKSKETGDHIPFVRLSVKGTKLGTISDKTGHFKLPHLPIGKNIIIIQAISYKTTEVEVMMKQGESTQLFVDLEDDVLLLDRVVVTGTRTKHIIKDVPVRTEVISKMEIDNKNACNVYQALEGTPGVRVENQCQSCNFTMVRMQGLGAEHTQVLINGQPIYSGLAGVYGLQQMSTVDIGQIEVIKGAGSALYGSSAIAGAINIVTTEPSFEPTTNIDVQFGRFNTNKYEISSSLRNESGDLGLNIFAQKMSDDAVDQTGEGNTTDQVFNNDGISDRVATDITNAGFGVFADGVLFDDDQLIVRAKSIFEKRQGGTMVDDYYKNPFTDGTESIFTNRYEIQISYQKSINDNIGLNYSFSSINHNREATNDSYLNDYLATHDNKYPDIREMRPYLASEITYTSTLTLNSKFFNHNLLFGVQAFHTALEESGMYVVVDDKSDYLGESYKSISKKNAKEFGMFLQDEWNVLPELTLVPGFRIDYHNSGEQYNTNKQVFTSIDFPETNFEETTINPRFAIKYEVDPDFILRFNAGTGFRAPYGFSEDLHLCSGSPRVWKSSDLKPETSYSVNLSADYYLSSYRFSLNIFRTDLKNKIGFTESDDKVSSLGYDYQWKNIDDAFVQGIEFTFIANLARNLDLGLDFTYNHGEYKNSRVDWLGTKYEDISKYISRFPVVTGDIKLEYRPSDWIFTFTGNYQGNMYIDYFSSDETVNQSKIKETDPFFLINLRASKDISNFKIYAGVNNLLNYIQDEKYVDDAAFLYAPVYGTVYYAGVSVIIQH